MCARTPATLAYWPRCLKPAPASLSQVSGLGMEVICQELHCSLCGEWEADGSPTLPVAHQHLTLKQFCWLSLLDASLGTLNQTIRPNGPHSPGLLFHSPRILCLTPQDKCTNPASLSPSKSKGPLHINSYNRAQGLNSKTVRRLAGNANTFS